MWLLIHSTAKSRWVQKPVCTDVHHLKILISCLLRVTRDDWQMKQTVTTSFHLPRKIPGIKDTTVLPAVWMEIGKNLLTLIEKEQKWKKERKEKKIIFF